jgi:alpha-beta hydrolase superfamily lysophospholipase
MQNEIVSDKPIGIIFYIHGFTDYSARFAHLGKRFSEIGYDFYSMD